LRRVAVGHVGINTDGVLEAAHPPVSSHRFYHRLGSFVLERCLLRLVQVRTRHLSGDIVIFGGDRVDRVGCATSGEDKRRVEDSFDLAAGTVLGTGSVRRLGVEF